MENKKNIWEIEACFTCPIAGYCFSLKEQKKIINTPGNSTHCRETYKLHQNVIKIIQEPGSAARKAQRILNNKYADFIEKYGEMPEKKFIKAWEQTTLEKDMPPMFYIAAVRKDLSDKSLLKIYGDLHMAGFLFVDTFKQLKKKMETRKENTTLFKSLLSEEKKRNKELLSENIRLRVQSKDFCKKSLGQYKTAQVDSVTQEKRRSALEKKLQKKEEELVEQKQRYLQLEKEMCKIKKLTIPETISYPTTVSQNGKEKIDASFRKQNRCPCDRRQCCKRFLIVGGLTRLKHDYKKIVECNGGKLDYHSGHIRKGKNNIEAMVKRSDMIICPVKHNSHNACKTIKSLCNKHKKDIRLIRSSSISAISSIISGNDSGDTSEPLCHLQLN